MARAMRVEYPGALYHITSRGNRRKRIFDDDEDREVFLRMVGEAVERFGWVITSYVLMINHFHLVLQTPKPNLSRGMQWLNGAYAAYYNRRHERVGHLFGERYKAIHVQSEEYLQRLSRYVVLNPARMKDAVAYDTFRWSSYRATAGLEPAPEWLSIAPLQPFFGEAATWRKNYVDYVAEGLLRADPVWRGLRRGIFLGTEEWLVRMKQRLTPALRKRDIPLDQRAAGRASMGTIVKEVAKAFGVTASEIKRSHGGVARQIAAFVGVYEGARRLRVIATALKLKSCSRVTQLVQECYVAMRANHDVRVAVQTLRLRVA